MVFNGDADDQDLCTLADKLVKTSDTDFPLKEKALYANWGLREIFKIIWRVYGGWILDDTNNSGEPEVKTNLVTTARNLYAFATAQLIDAMEWLDANGNWNPLKPITLEEIIAMGYAESNFMTTNGNPIYYRPVQNGIRIYPDSDTARASALKARLRRDISPFASTSTSVSPGIDSTLHEAVAVFMAYKFADINTLSSLPARLADWLSFAGNGNTPGSIEKHYMQKYRQQFPAAIRHRADIVQDYI